MIMLLLLSNSPLRRSGMARVNEGSHSPTCHPRASAEGMSHILPLVPPPQSVAVLWWPVLV